MVAPLFVMIMLGLRDSTIGKYKIYLLHSALISFTTREGSCENSFDKTITKYLPPIYSKLR